MRTVAPVISAIAILALTAFAGLHSPPPGDEHDAPSSAWYDLEVGTTRYYSFCWGIGVGCTDAAHFEARETVVGHVVLGGDTYAEVEWWYRAAEDRHQPDPVWEEGALTFHFAMEGSELWQYVEGERRLVYDFGLAPGDSLRNFVGRVHGWEIPLALNGGHPLLIMLRQREPVFPGKQAGVRLRHGLQREPARPDLLDEHGLQGVRLPVPELLPEALYVELR
jgi:hypothetical protein